MTGYRSTLETPAKVIAGAPRWVSALAISVTVVAGFWVLAGVAVMALVAILAPRHFG
jgi:hypothetical protein